MLSLSFNNTRWPDCPSRLSRQKGHCAFIGGLQGTKNIGPDIIRDATKACYGLFLSGSF